MKTIAIQFKDLDDFKYFMKYVELAKAQSGTVSGLYCGLMCSALRRADVSTIFKPAKAEGNA